jgi:hypothetical protein
MKRFFAVVIILAALTPLVRAEEVTLIDFSKLSGDTLPEGDNPVNAIAIEKWDIHYGRIFTADGSYDPFIKESPSKQYGFVLGARFRISSGEQINIMPRIPIPDDPAFENGYGLVRGNKRIMAISARIYGLNYSPVYIRLNVIDADGKIIPVELGSLDYDGWKDLSVDGITVDYHGSLRFNSFEVVLKFKHQIESKRWDIDPTVVVYFKDVRIVFDDGED